MAKIGVLWRAYLNVYFILLLHRALVFLNLECSVWFWHLHLKKSMALTKNPPVLKGMHCITFLTHFCALPKHLLQLLCSREDSGLAGHLWATRTPPLSSHSAVLEQGHSKIWPKPNETKQQGIAYTSTLGCFDHLCHPSVFEDTVVWSANVSAVSFHADRAQNTGWFYWEAFFGEQVWQNMGTISYSAQNKYIWHCL